MDSSSSGVSSFNCFLIEGRFPGSREQSSSNESSGWLVQRTSTRVLGVKLQSKKMKYIKKDVLRSKKFSEFSSRCK